MIQPVKQADSADKTPILKLRRVIVIGAEVLPPGQLDEISAPFLGQMVSQADLLDIAARMTSLYRDKGYFLSRTIIPPQDIASGTVRFQVIEGQISSITVKGDETGRFGTRRLLQDLVRPGPAILADVERKLLLVNDLPGVKVLDTAFTEEPEASGRFSLVVSLETWRLHSAQGVDNTGSQAVGPWQSYATAAVNSAFVAGDSTSLSLSTVPNLPSQLLFGRLSYDAPLGGDGARVGGSAIYSDVAPGDARQAVNNHTLTQGFELRGSFVPYQTRKSAVTVVASLGLTDITEKDVMGTRYDDHLRTISLLGQYRFQDDLGGFNALSLVYRQGLSLLGATIRGSPLASRPGASGEFTTIGFNAVRVQKLTDAWSLKAGGAGQYSSTPLLLSQQYFLGSAGLGPGYVSGDTGLSGLLELRYDKTLNSKVMRGFQLYGFVDGGIVWAADTNNSASLASVGLGARFYLPGQLEAGLAIATPVASSLGLSEPRPVRVLFSLSNSFKLCPEKHQLRCS